MFEKLSQLALLLVIASSNIKNLVLFKMNREKWKIFLTPQL